ncbi:hypothetical protein [Candidatus Lokiarchaeum ossiferum]
MIASNQTVIDNFEGELAGHHEVDHAFSEQNMAFHALQLLHKMEEVYYWH